MTNEKIIKELQKFNSDLEKHLPNMNMDLFKRSDLFAEGEPTEDMLALLINEVNDLKTELALTRKNLSDNIEGMIMRVLNTERNAILKQVNDYNAKMVANFRNSIGSYITQINEELSTIRKEFNKVKISSENLTEMFNSSKDTLTDISLSLVDFKNIRNEVKNGINKLNERLDETDNNIKKIKKIDTPLPMDDFKYIRNEIKNGINQLNQRLDETDNNIKNINQKINTPLSIDEFKNIRNEVRNGISKLNKKINDTENNIKYIKKEIPHLDFKKELNQIRSNVLENKKQLMNFENNCVENSNPVKYTKIAQENSDKELLPGKESDYLKKVITIDERIKKLESLK